MKIAVIGSGISGLVAAHRLSKRHDVTVFEADDRAGGHTRTVEVEVGGRTHAVDMGFIVYNERTYPGLVSLFEELGVDSQPTSMSFGVRCDQTGLEWGSRSLRGIFAQPTNALQPRFLRMLRDIVRFNLDARRLLEVPNEKLDLGDYVRGRGYGREFVDHYLIPMGAAIWSASATDMLRFPVLTFVRFFENHGLLSVRPDVTWRVVRGGSARYLEKLLAPLGERVRTGCPVLELRREPRGVRLHSAQGREDFDRVVLAVHSDQALSLLADPSPAEREILGAIRYQDNRVVLHTDAALLPSHPAARASWNYRIPRKQEGPVFVTYDMNRLQGIESSEPLLVTLNAPGPIAPDHVRHAFTTQHPIFDVEAIHAQAHRRRISGERWTHYCGAYWRYGFHEDGLQSALDVVQELDPGAMA